MLFSSCSAVDLRCNDGQNLCYPVFPTVHASNVAIIRTAEPAPASVPVSDLEVLHDVVPPLRLDLTSGELWIGSQKGPEPSDLEYQLLRYLYHNKGQICSKAEIVAAIYVPQGELKDELVKTYESAIGQLVRRLRCRIEEDPSQPKYVATIKGRGYRLDHTD